MKIQVKNAVKKYRDMLILNNINLEFETGNAYGIIGKNGSGKTQLMKAICGHTKLTSGQIIQDGIIIRNRNNFILNAGIIVDTPGF
ncbi:ATP-binding cassette domain-containing protein [Mycoplasma sp. P36-A1]|uniref:ATP-binding cassette domain-containing protein n=1 Tax=Mycoplasma sp. P36-A1 TaxID=3252900 RepID=UPI003C2EDC38